MCTDASGRFQSARPQTFQVGDIVEVQVSFIAVPIRDNKWKISTILRSISLFDGSFTKVRIFPITPLSYNDLRDQDAFVKGVMRRTAPEERPKISLKRKVGYIEEQVSTTRAKMSEMQIDAQTKQSVEHDK